LLVIASVLGFPLLSAAVDRHQLTARDLYYSSVESPGEIDASRVPKEQQALAVRYAVLKRVGDDFVEVAPSARFHENDEIRLKVTSNRSCRLYVIQRGSTGNWSLLFPDPDINSGSNEIKGGEDHVIPGESGASFVFDGQPGEDRIFLLLTRTPVPELDEISQRKGSSSQSAGRSTISDEWIEHQRVQFQRDLIYTPAQDRNSDKAVYVANTAASADRRDRIVVDLRLVHN